MNKRIVILYVERLLILFMLYGCVYPTAHENFKNNLKLYIGREINSVSAYSPKNLRVSVLSNGNLEYRYIEQYRDHGLCTTIFEVDAATKKIIRADFAGLENDCFIPL
jgi:2-keto-3-deoxy-galactonokinase